MKSIIDFLENINSDDKVIVVFHNDGDGICSCTLLLKYLRYKEAKITKIITQPMPMNNNLASKIKMYNPTKVIFTDLALEQQKDIALKLKNCVDIGVIDHHQMNGGLDVPYYNPRKENPEIYQSASYCVYKILKKIYPEIEKYNWIAGIGIVSDYDIRWSKDVLEELKKDYSIELKIESLLESKFGKISDIINYSKSSKKIKSEEIVNIIDGMESIDDLSKNQKSMKMLETYNQITTELETIKQTIKSNVEKYDNVIFFRLKSKFNIKSQVSTILSNMYPGYLIIVYEDKNGQVKVSARCQNKKINSGDILNKAGSFNEKISAGGHEAASGAFIPKKDWEQYKENLIKLTEQQ